MIKEKLMNDFKQAMKDKDLIRKNTIQLVRAAILNKEKDLQKELNDSECEQVIAKQVKERNDALSIYTDKCMVEKTVETQKEIDILKEYLPQPLSEGELSEIVDNKISELGATNIKDMGKVIKTVKEIVGSRAEGKVISDMVKRKLG